MIQPSVGARDSWTPALIRGIDVDAVAAAAQGCIDVDGLDGGPFDVVASYLPGRRVPGVRVGSDRVTVQVRTRWGASAPQVAAQLRVALAPVLAEHALDIVVSDIADPPEPRTGAVTAAGRQGSEDGWTSTSAGPDGPGSSNIIPTVVATQPSSPPALPPST
jgi:hypothetical protein